MKKTILSALAAGALALGGAASAQDLGGVLSSIFGFGTPSYPVYNSGATPAVVAGTQSSGTVYVDQYGRRVDQYGRVLNVDQYGRPIASVDQYGRPVTVDQYGRQVYTDQYGRQVYTDQYGRQVIAQSGTQTITGYDAWGRPIYGTSNYGYGYEQDRDGDGVADVRDRWPNDRRYW
jgi:hypothetical protein